MMNTVIFAGPFSTFILIDGKALLGCGHGLGSSFRRITLPLLAADEQIIQVAAGHNHLVVLSSAGRLWGCGSHFPGESPDLSILAIWSLPLGDGERITQVAAGSKHTVILSSMGRLWVCGNNNHGQLGVGRIHEHRTFQPITLPLASGERIIQLAAGYDSTIAFSSTNRLWVCGGNQRGQLGLGDTDTVDLCYTFQPITLPLASGERITQCVVGASYIIVFSSTGRLWGCGSNRDGQLGMGIAIKGCKIFTPIALPMLANDEQIIQLASNGYGITAFSSTGRLWGFGANHHLRGEVLRYEHNGLTLAFTCITPPSLAPSERIVQVAMGNHYTIVLSSAGELWGCGANMSSQLGLGHVAQSCRAFVKIAQLAHPAMESLDEMMVKPVSVIEPPPCGFPTEVFKVIFDYLPQESLFRLMQTSKYFRGLVSGLYHWPVMSLGSQVTPSEISLADVIRNAQRMYASLPPAEQEAFRQEFLQHVGKFSTAPKLARLLPPDTFM